MVLSGVPFNFWGICIKHWNRTTIQRRELCCDHELFNKTKRKWIFLLTSICVFDFERNDNKLHIILNGSTARKYSGFKGHLKLMCGKRPWHSIFTLHHLRVPTSNFRNVNKSSLSIKTLTVYMYIKNYLISVTKNVCNVLKHR